MDQQKDKMKTKISVIIPCYNVEKFVTECVESVVRQNFQPLEIICVNDGSKDNTQQVLLNLADQFSYLKVFNQKNGGQSAAINKGIRESKGEYLQFLDADDLLYPDKLLHQAKILEELDYRPDIVATAIEKRYENGKVKTAKEKWFGPWEGLARYEIGLTSSNLWRREAVLDVNGFDEAMPSNKEHDMIFRMLKNNATVIHDPVPLTIKRERSSGSISSGNDHRHLKRKVEHRFRIYEYTKKHGLLDSITLNHLIEENISNLKSIYKRDKEMALELHKTNVPINFKMNGSSGKAYSFMFNTFGFKTTEFLRSLFGK